MKTDRFLYRAWFTDEYPVAEMRGKMVYSGNGLDYDACVEGAGYGNIILMLCTGIRCRSGNLIYEGDIIQTMSQDPETNTVLPLSKFIVHWHPEGASFKKLREDSEQFYLHPVNEEQKEILGNIYQNPDLVSSPRHFQFVSDSI